MSTDIELLRRLAQLSDNSQVFLLISPTPWSSKTPLWIPLKEDCLVWERFLVAFKVLHLGAKIKYFVKKTPERDT